MCFIICISNGNCHTYGISDHPLLANFISVVLYNNFSETVRHLARVLALYGTRNRVTFQFHGPGGLGNSLFQVDLSKPKVL